MSRARLIHDFNNLNAVKEGYEWFATQCQEVMTMIEAGTIKTKSQVEAERKKRGIERR